MESLTTPSPKKKRKNSKAKGSTFEREIVKHLNKWSGLQLRRTPLSGGWNQTTKPGDIITDHPQDDTRWIYNIECKMYAAGTFVFQELLSHPQTSMMLKWWKQCESDSSLSKKTPLLIFSQNYDKDYVMFRAKDFSDTHATDITSWQQLWHQMIFWNGFVFMLLPDFLQAFPYPHNLFSSDLSNISL